MAATYTADPSNNAIDRLRFMLGDTDSTTPLLQDAEYEYIIACNPDNMNKQIASAFRAAATAIAIHATKRRLGPQSEDDGDRLNYYKEQADFYEKLSQYSGTPPLPEYASPKVFSKNMMANDS